MSRRVELRDASGTFHRYCSVDEAARLRISKQVEEISANVIARRVVDVSKRANWQPKQSGYAGPLVLQMV